MISKNTYPRNQVIGDILYVIGRSTMAFFIFMKKRKNEEELDFITLSDDLKRVLLLL